MTDPLTPKKRKWERQHVPRIDATPEQLARAIVTPQKPPDPSLRKGRKQPPPRNLGV